MSQKHLFSLWLSLTLQIIIGYCSVLKEPDRNWCKEEKCLSKCDMISNSIELKLRHPQSDSYALTINEYAEDCTGLNLVDKATNFVYQNIIPLTDYNLYHNQQSKSNQIHTHFDFINIIKLSVEEDQSYKILSQKNNMMLNFKLNTRLSKYDINIPLKLLEISNFEVTSIISQTLKQCNDNYNELKQTTQKSMDILKTELRKAQDDIVSLQSVVNSFGNNYALKSELKQTREDFTALQTQQPFNVQIKDVECTSASGKYGASCHAVCPDDYVVISGGCKVTATRWYIKESHRRNNGWWCTGYEDHGSGNYNYKVQGFARCLKW